jgi:1-deoxy-D-xylulose-5-phosphate synthase
MSGDKKRQSKTRKIKRPAKKSGVTDFEVPDGLEESARVREAILEALSNNDKLVVLASSLATHALPDPSNRLANLTREVATGFPERFFGLGELLEDLVPTVHKLLSEGLRPLVLMGSTDLARSYAGLSALCAAHSPVLFLLAAGSEEGQIRQPAGINDLAIVRTLLPLTVGVPGNARELQRQLVMLMQEQSGPVMLYYCSPDPAMPEAKPTLSPAVGIGKGQMLQEGKDLAIVALGAAVGPALALSQALAKAGFEAAVVDATWLSPMDEPLLSAVANYFPRLITLETGDLTAGFGAAFLEMLESNELHLVRVRRFSMQTEPPRDPKALIEHLVLEIKHFMEKVLQEEGFIGPTLFHSRPSEAT